MRTNAAVVLFLLTIAGCSKPAPNKASDSGTDNLQNAYYGKNLHDPRTWIEKTTHPPIFTTRGIHPAVSAWYYQAHPRGFQCDKSSDDPYECESCPVGKPDRIVDVPDKNKEYDTGYIAIDKYFACDAINTLIPEKAAGADDDVFLCTHKPLTGSVRIDGHVYHCGDIPPAQSVSLGDVQPGESKTITIPFGTTVEIPPNGQPNAGQCSIDGKIWFPPRADGQCYTADAHK